MRKKILLSALLITTPVFSACSLGAGSSANELPAPKINFFDEVLDSYNVKWARQSTISQIGDETVPASNNGMPVGGGGTGLTVWVEDDEIYFYIGKNDAFDERNTLCKLGRVKLTLDPNPFTGGVSFTQELMLKDGYLRIMGTGADSNEVTVDIWVDAFTGAAHVEIESAEEINASAEYQMWRTETLLKDPLYIQTAREQSADGSYPYTEFTLYPDAIAYDNEEYSDSRFIPILL